MELVYLWVEDYKNIKNEGFNFSPRFTCSYDESTNELTIDEKKDFVSIFPDIINVTAIVGENGSGKSNIFKLFFEILYIKPNESNLKYFYIVSQNNKLKYITNNMKINKVVGCIEELTNILSLFNTYYINISHLENIYNKIQNKENKITYLGIDNDFNLDIFRFNQVFNTAKLLSNKQFNKIITNELNIKQPFYLKFNYFIETEAQRMMSYNQFKLLSDNTFLYLCYLRLNYSDEEIDTENELLKILDIGNSDASKFASAIKTITQKLYPSDYIKIQEIISCSEKGSDNSLFIKIENYKYFLDNIYEVFEYFIPFFEFNFTSDNQDNIQLSSGETTILFYLNNIINNIQTITDNILLIDEIELYLHPNWQKRILNIVQKIFITKQGNVLILIATHSPFIISDLPKENIIFLKKDKETGNSINATEETDINPFGANIHTLLSHGFFMEDGLMGEFAKGKINEIKEFYDTHKSLDKKSDNFQSIKKDYESKKKNFKNIHSIIGEPFLKTVIGNYLDELEIMFYGKKEFLKNEIARLQEMQKSLDA